ncbi:MAG: ABC transporter ATP-binding protein [Bacillota bacterium]
MLKVENLCFSYSSKNILNDINFRAGSGEFICLLGANGSGKTTLLKCLNGLLNTDSGQILINNKNIKNLSRRQIAELTAVVPQENQTVFSYTVKEIAVMGANPYISFVKGPTEKDYLKVYNILEKLNIRYLAEKKFNQISGGERQLVLIARALMQQSNILLLDEPNAHLDFKNQHLLMEIMQQLRYEGKTIITAIHDPNLAYRYCQKALILSDGSLIADGRVKKVMTEDNLSRAYDTEIKLNKGGTRIEFCSEAFSHKTAN